MEIKRNRKIENRKQFIDKKIKKQKNNFSLENYAVCYLAHMNHYSEKISDGRCGFTMERT